MHFKAGQKEPKATLEIGEVTYKIYAPTMEQADNFSIKYDELKDKPVELAKLMRSYVSDLGSIPMDQLMKIDADMFSELFLHIISPKKK